MTQAALTSSSPNHLTISGEWTTPHVKTIQSTLKSFKPFSTERKPSSNTTLENKKVILDGAQLEVIDSVGVWLLQKRLQALRDQHYTIQCEHWKPDHQKLMNMIGEYKNTAPPAAHHYSWLENIGLSAESAWKETLALLSFIGESTLVLIKQFKQPGQWRVQNILYIIQTSGFNALLITGLTSFLIGIVIAYLTSNQLKLYGANIFVVDFIGYAMLRELAPLITAILIAGRSGSAYAAEIGTMMVTNEIEAMRTLGIEPIGLLVWPKILGLLVALPLLTVFADITGVWGGMLLSRVQLDINVHDFLARFSREIEVKALLIGVGKAFVFAYIIAIVGCFQGFRTKSNADSVGRQTTRSVVQSIFIMIVTDALFSVLFSMLNL